MIVKYYFIRKRYLSSANSQKYSTLVFWVSYFFIKSIHRLRILKNSLDQAK